MLRALKAVGTCVALCIGSTLSAQLVAPPVIDWVSLPSTANTGSTVTVGAGAHANPSDNSDGNDWNTPSMLVVAFIKIELQRPGENWVTLVDWLSPWQTPAQNWATFTVNSGGTHYIRIQAMDGRPWFTDSFVYAISVPNPAPSITSQLSMTVNQGQWVSYTITATSNPTSFGASGLPAGLSLNPSTGVISGWIPTNGGVQGTNTTISSTITATNSAGTDTKTLTWNRVAAAISTNSSVSPLVDVAGAPRTLVRSGSANFGLAWTENVIWPPSGSAQVLGSLPLGSQTYTPNAGAGTYSYQFRLIDSLMNFRDQWIPFHVSSISPLSVQVSGGSTFDALTATPTISFGQTVTISATANDPSGTMTQVAINGDFGVSGNWGTYGGSATFSPTNSRSFSATYQPTARNTGNHWIAASGFSGNWWSRGFNLVVNRATPNATFSSRVLGPGNNGIYTVASGDLNATFTNPFSTTVAAPSGSVTYSLVGPGTAVVPSTQLGPGNHTIRASYPGDANYNARTIDAVFTVTGPTTPTSFQSSTVGSTFVTLSWGAATVAAPATIARYDIYRNGALVGNTTGLSFTVSGLNPKSTETFSIRAVDSAGNQSPHVTLTVETAASFVVFTPAP